MSDNQYPRAGYVGVGARYRWRAIDSTDAPQTMQAALAAYEAEEDEPLDLRDRREFFNGWRRGAATYALNNLSHLTNYLDADGLDAYGEDLMALDKKWRDLLDAKGKV